MIARRKELHAIVEYLVNEAVGLIDSPRPDISAELLEMLGLPEATIRIAHHGFDQIENSERDLPVVVHPITQIVAALVLENRDTLGSPLSY